MSTTTATSGYTLLGASVVVRGAEARLAAWLDEALTPELVPCTPVTAPAGAPAVTVEIASEPWEPDGVAVTIDRAACFALDQKLSVLPVRRTGDRTWIQDDHFRVVYELGPRTVRLSAFGDRGRIGPAALRVIRELAVAQAAARQRGLIELHAAGAVIDGRVVLLVGPKGAGKTTTLVRLASGGRADLVANDRVLAWPSADDAWAVRGVPTLVNVRRPTLDRFPHLFGGVPSVEHVIDRTVAELEALPRGGHRPMEAGAPDGADLALSAAQLAHLVGSRRVGGGSLGAIVAVRVDEDLPTFRCRPVGRAAARALLDANRFGAATHPRRATVFETMVGHAPSATPASVLDGLARDVPVLELTVGTTFLRDPAVADAVVDALVDALAGA